MFHCSIIQIPYSVHHASHSHKYMFMGVGFYLVPFWLKPHGSRFIHFYPPSNPKSTQDTRVCALDLHQHYNVFVCAYMCTQKHTLTTSASIDKPKSFRCCAESFAAIAEVLPLGPEAPSKSSRTRVAKLKLLSWNGQAKLLSPSY